MIFKVRKPLAEGACSFDEQDLVLIETQLAVEDEMHLPVDDEGRDDKHHGGRKLKDHQSAAKSRMTGATADITLQHLYGAECRKIKGGIQSGDQSDE